MSFFLDIYGWLAENGFLYFHIEEQADRQEDRENGNGKQ